MVTAVAAASGGVVYIKQSLFGRIDDVRMRLVEVNANSNVISLVCTNDGDGEAALADAEIILPTSDLLQQGTARITLDLPPNKILPPNSQRQVDLAGPADQSIPEQTEPYQRGIRYVVYITISRTNGDLREFRLPYIGSREK